MVGLEEQSVDLDFKISTRKKLYWGYVLLYLVFQIVFGIVYGLLFTMLNGRGMTADEIAQFGSLTLLVTGGATFLWFIYAAKDNIRNAFIDYRDNAKRYTVNVVVGFIVMFGLSSVLGIVYELLGIEGSSANEEVLSTMITNSPLLVMLPICFLIPVVEELLFRGALLEGIKNKINLPTSIIIVNVLFAGIHVMDPDSFIFFPIYFGLGLAITFLYYRSNRNILVPIMVHVLNNTVSLLATLLLF